MGWKPHKVVAVLLGLFAPPISMLYLGRPRLAIFYFIAPLAIATVEFVLAAPWLRIASVSSLVAIICAVHAYRIAAQAVSVETRYWYSRWYGFTGILLGYVMAVFLLRAYFYEPFRMPSASMYPGIEINDYMIAEKYGYGNYSSYGITISKTASTAMVGRGDLIVFKYPEDPSVSFVKRVVGVPGDTLVFYDQQLVINGNPVPTEAIASGEYPARYMHGDYLYKRESIAKEDYVVAYLRGHRGEPFETTVPANSYFVLGDNRDNSRDSRYWGFVDRQSIIGKVIYITGK